MERVLEMINWDDLIITVQHDAPRWDLTRFSSFSYRLG